MSDDLIRRSDAINALHKHFSSGFDTDRWWNSTTVLFALNSVPSADRQKGEWIRNRYWSRGVGMGEEYGFFYKCSMCEYEVESGYTRCGFNFCPNCGCRMKGADDE